MYHLGLKGRQQRWQQVHFILEYLSHVMEVQLPTDVEILHDLYLDRHQFTCTLNGAVIGLKQILSGAQSEI